MALLLFHEYTIVKIPSERREENAQICMEFCNKLATGYIQQDLEAGFNPKNNITGREIYDMWRKNPYCSASGKYLHAASVDEDKRLSMDRINNGKPHTPDNCRVMSLADNKRHSTSQLYIYREKMGYTPKIFSNYSNDMMKIMCGTPMDLIKTKPHMLRFNDQCLNNFRETTYEVNGVKYEGIKEKCKKRNEVTLLTALGEEVVCKYKDLVIEQERIACYDVRRSYQTVMYQSYFGEPLPEYLDLVLVEIEAGRSSQATLLGRDSITVESLYLSRTLANEIGASNAYLTKTTSEQMSLLEEKMKYESVS